MKKHRICVGAWAGGMADTLKKFGVELGPDDRYPTQTLTMDEIYILMRKFTDEGVGVQLMPYIYSEKLDYVLWIDTAKGRFRQR